MRVSVLTATVIATLLAVSGGRASAGEFVAAPEPVSWFESSEGYAATESLDDLMRDRPPTGACCWYGQCMETTQLDCFGRWLGAGTVCAPFMCAPCPGDMTCDGIVDFDDIGPFVIVLMWGDAPYFQQYPYCDWNAGDFNGDGVVDFADIDPFVAALFTECR